MFRWAAEVEYVASDRALVTVPRCRCGDGPPPVLVLDQPERVGCRDCKQVREVRPSPQAQSLALKTHVAVMALSYAGRSESIAMLIGKHEDLLLALLGSDDLRDNNL